MELSFLGSPPDMAIIFVVALLIFGPKKLPEFGKQLGQALKEFKKISEEFTGAATSVKADVESVYKPLVLPGQSNAAAPLYNAPVLHVSAPIESMEPFVEPATTAHGGLSFSTMPPPVFSTTHESDGPSAVEHPYTEGK